MANNLVKYLSIIEINVNSLIKLSRRYYLNTFIKQPNPDLVLLNETKLNNNHKISFENYNIIRKDRVNSKRGGGTAILIKEFIKYNSYTNKKLNSFKYLETCIVKIPLKPNSFLFIISAYFPSGNHNSKLFCAELQQLFKLLNLANPSNFYVLAGDLNCKHSDWGNPVNNNKGNILKAWLSYNEIKFCPRIRVVVPI